MFNCLVFYLSILECFLIVFNKTVYPLLLCRRASGFLAKFTLHGSQNTVVVMNNHFVATKEKASHVIATFKFEEGKNKVKMVNLDPDIFFSTDKVT